MAIVYEKLTKVYRQSNGIKASKGNGLIIVEAKELEKLIGKYVILVIQDRGKYANKK